MNQAHDLTVTYALQGLDGVERVSFESHLADCGPCATDVADLVDAAELLSQGIELEPPSVLRERVLELTIHAGGSRPTAPDAAGERPARRRWFGGA